jgi:hypothetical protein
MKYHFDNEAKRAFEKLLGSMEDEITVGDFEASPEDKPRAFFWETGAGNNKASVRINQSTGKLVFKYEMPNSKENDWCEHEDNIEHMLKKHIVSQKGGRRRTKRRSAKRRSTKRRGTKRRAQRGGQSDTDIAQSYPEGTVVSTDPESGIDGVPTVMGNRSFVNSQPEQTDQLEPPVESDVENPQPDVQNPAAVEE